MRKIVKKQRRRMKNTFCVFFYMLIVLSCENISKIGIKIMKFAKIILYRKFHNKFSKK